MAPSTYLTLWNSLTAMWNNFSELMCFLMVSVEKTMSGWNIHSKKLRGATGCTITSLLAYGFVNIVAGIATGLMSPSHFCDWINRLFERHQIGVLLFLSAPLLCSSAAAADVSKWAGHCGSSKSLRGSREGQALYKDERQLKTHWDNAALKRLAYPPIVRTMRQTHTFVVEAFIGGLYCVHPDKGTGGRARTHKQTKAACGWQVIIDSIETHSHIYTHLQYKSPEEISQRYSAKI